jgi:hypothetical protein
VREAAAIPAAVLRGPAAVVAGKVVFSALTIAAYGFHRDELYLQQCALHPAWGYVDHGPLVPALGFLAFHGLGASPAAARVLSSAAAAATVWAAASAARTLGGGLLAQTLAAALVAIAPLFVYSGAVFGTNAFDQLFWTLAALCAVRIAAGEARVWRLLGLSIGIGILAKPTLIVGAGCLALALAVSRARPTMTALAGALGLAVVVAAPLAIWEQAHGWPGSAFVAADRPSVISLGPIAVFAGQVRLLGPLSCAASVVGVIAALRRGAVPALRAAALPFAFALVAFALLGGKPYYASSAAPLAIAAGAVVLVDVVRDRPRLSFAALAVASIFQCVGSLPLLPASPLVLRLHPDRIQFADWSALAARISRLHAASGLGPRAPVLTDSYGSAAALERFGGPPVLSGSNAYSSWAWQGAAEEPDAALAIGYPPSLLRRFFRDVRPAGAVELHDGDNRFDFPRQAWVCTGRIASLQAGWSAFTHFD